MNLQRILTKVTLLLCLVSLFFPSLPAQAVERQIDVSEESVPADVGDGDWYMAGANPQRTSWVSEEVRGELYVEWYRPIEAYIDQKVQIITAYDNLYVSTSRGLYVLKAATGDVVWRYDTQMPLGHSPTVIDGKVYVGGYDKKLHALDALTGAKLWEFSGAGAGFSVNPLVVEGKVYAGNRDGYFYAVNAETGQLDWQYPPAGQPPLGPIKFSAAYADGVLYFASTDMHAYALNAANGALVWRSAKLPGESFQSWWPVIYRDKVVLSGMPGYRFANPGTRSLVDNNGANYIDFVNGIERDDIFPPETNPTKGTLIGPTFTASSQNGQWDWIEGTEVIDASRIIQYFEDDGAVRFDRRTNKPWRRTYLVLNRSDGNEFTFDSDGDGNPEYAPILFYGTKNGNAYPALVMPDGVIYQSNPLEYLGSISRGEVTGWKLGTQYLSRVGGGSAVDEPQALSGGGQLIYRNLCCDRVAGVIADVGDVNFKSQEYWHYSTPLTVLSPGYDAMWEIRPSHPRLDGNYVGRYGSINGIYHNHGDQNPLIPYQGRLFTHRSNAIIAAGPTKGAKQLPLLEVQPAQDTVELPSTEELQNRLASEIQKMIDAGRLRPGYHNDGMPAYPQLWDYFNNPGDTLYTLAIAYPHLPEEMKSDVRAYMQDEYNAYFQDKLVAEIGWDSGGSREYMTVPPEVQDAFQNHPSTERADGWSWQYPQHNFYALWKYAEIFPENANEIYQQMKGKLQVPAAASDQKLSDYPWEHNGYIAGYIGFLNLQTLAGQAQADQSLRAQVQQELDRLLSLRVSQFSKDTPWTPERLKNEKGGWHIRRKFNVAANFMLLVPELGEYLRDEGSGKAQEAYEEYNYISPFWFVSSFEGSYYEGVRQHLYEMSSLLQAKAYILESSQEELYKYLDAPVFRVGDLFYIQNLVTVLNAQTSEPSSQPPTIVPSGGLFADEVVTVELSSSAPDAAIHYTLDGSTPTADSIHYTGPFQIDRSTVVKARAFQSGHSASNVTVAQFILGSSFLFLPTVQR